MAGAGAEEVEDEVAVGHGVQAVLGHVREPEAAGQPLAVLQ